MSGGRQRSDWSDAALAGVAAVAPTFLMILPFGALSGAIFAEAGLGIFETMAFSIGVFAGASQLASLELLRDGASWFIVVATGLAINLRFVLYAATLQPHLVGASRRARIGAAYLTIDNMVPIAIARYRARPLDSVDQRVAFYVAGALASALVWHGATLIGFYGGAAAPDWLGLDFAAPIAFLALAMPLLADRPSWAAGVTAAVVSILARDAPANLGIILAALAGVAAGVIAEGVGPRGETEASAPRGMRPPLRAGA